MLSDGYDYYISNICTLFEKKQFSGWGRKRSGKFAVCCHKHFGGTLTLYEDGFIHSIGLGVNGAQTFSKVEDNVGIYYDASVPSDRENILNYYDFNTDPSRSLSDLLFK